MCGINCAVSGESDVIVEEMSRATLHRGPDQYDTYETDSLTLGLNRLAILDPSPRGKQPMEFDGKVISYNGEIYNFRELRQSLIEAGYDFQSETDTEVILKGYVEEGISFLRRLNGIAAIVIYDSDKDQLLLFRDRLGIKPLYFYQPSTRELVVSSEIKAFTEAFDNKFTIDGEAVNAYLESRNVPQESFFVEISPVDPGQLITYDLKESSLSQNQLIDLFDDIDRSRHHEIGSQREGDLIDELDEILNEAVQRQLIADVPLAAICSGGLDSSLIAAIASQYKSDLDLYHVSVDHPRLDESRYAEIVADHLNLDITIERLDQDIYNEMVNECLRYNDLPFVHANSIGMNQIFERVHSDGIKVLLTGEGADELFGGYTRYKGFYYAALLNKYNPIKHIAGLAPRSDQLPFAFLNSEDDILNHFLIDRYDLSGSSNQLTSDRRQLIQELLDRYAHISNPIRRKSMAYMASELRHFLPPLLRRADRMSMKSSTEARVPYLDNVVIEFAMNLPHKYKINLLDTKYLLKKVADRYLPTEIVHREKEGFHIPISDWLEDTSYPIKDDKLFKREFYRRWSEANKLATPDNRS